MNKQTRPPYEELGEREDILRGLEVRWHRRRRRGAGAAAIAGNIVLSPSFLTIADSATVGTVVGTPSVVGGISASYTFTMSDPSGQFTILGGNIVVASALTAGTYPVTITATGSTPGDILTLPTTITVTHAGYIPTYFIYGF